MDEGEHTFIAAYAGFACISAAHTAMYDIDFDTAGLPEIEVDPDEWTACFYSCAAYCGAATWEKDKGDDRMRKEFWEWFLDRAVLNLYKKSGEACETQSSSRVSTIEIERGRSPLHRRG